MQRGRKPKPTALKLVQGRRVDSQEPKFTGTPEKPDYLDDIGSRMWDVLLAELGRTGMVTQVDAGALAGACANYSRAVQCERIICDKGMTMLVGENNYSQQRPEIAIGFKAWQIFRAFCSEFGLTPSSRVRLTAPGQPIEDDLEAALR
jgi:P27 family predicted phage terminase small subunit